MVMRNANFFCKFRNDVWNVCISIMKKKINSDRVEDALESTVVLAREEPPAELLFKWRLLCCCCPTWTIAPIGPWRPSLNGVGTLAVTTPSIEVLVQFWKALRNSWCLSYESCCREMNEWYQINYACKYACRWFEMNDSSTTMYKFKFHICNVEDWKL